MRPGADEEGANDAMSQVQHIEFHHLEPDGFVCCDNCGFRYGAEHTVASEGPFDPSSGTGGYSCPLCEATRLADRNQRMEAVLRDSYEQQQREPKTP